MLISYNSIAAIEGGVACGIRQFFARVSILVVRALEFGSTMEIILAAGCRKLDRLRAGFLFGTYFCTEPHRRV